MSENIICSSCSKESYAKIPVLRVLEKLDECFSKNDLAAAGRLLEYWENEAIELGDKRGLIEILNEEIGYYRRIADREKGINAVNRAIALIEELGGENNESSGTVYLNAATTLKSFKETLRAMELYRAAKKIYDNTLDKNDFRFAAYYNNVSSAYAELGEYIKAEKCCLKALEILKNDKRYLGERAVTHVSLAHLYYDMDNLDERVYIQMEIAWDLLSCDEIEKNGNFAFVCSKCYPSFSFFGYFEYAKRLKELMEEIYERN